MCMHCEHDTPCVKVCPQQAVEVDKATGIVMQMPQRCLGCRYCMTACPYHARYFNWWDPSWPAGMEKSLNPGVAVRMRGVVEKCNLCHARLAFSASQSCCRGQARNRFRRLCSGLRRGMSDWRHSIWQPCRPKRPSRAGGSFPGGIPLAGAHRHRAQGLLQVEGGMGESIGRVEFRTSFCNRTFGGPSWLAAPLPTAD